MAEMAGNVTNAAGLVQDHVLDNFPVLQYFFVTCLAMQSILGTVGNLLVIGSVFIMEPLRHPGNAFIVNLALADLCITAMAQPANVVGALSGERYFHESPVFCSLVAVFCSSGCICSCWGLLTIAVNRYVLICKLPYYNKVYTVPSTILQCLAVWVIGIGIQLPNHVGWGDLRYSNIFFYCTFASHVRSYALFYSAVGLIVPLVATFLAYWRIYMTVKNSRMTRNMILSKRKPSDNVSDPLVNSAISETSTSSKTLLTLDVPTSQKFYDDLRIVYTLFRVYLIFVVMWTPLVMLILLGGAGSPHHVWYVAALMIAHGNSSVNCLVYAASIEHFREGYKTLLCFGRRGNGPSLSKRDKTRTVPLNRSKNLVKASGSSAFAAEKGFCDTKL